MLNAFWVRVLSIAGLTLGSWPLSAIAQTSGADSLSWGTLTQFFQDAEDRGKGAPGVGRPTPNGRHCLISPAFNEPVWHLQPMLLWKSYTRTAGIRSSDEPQTLLWADLGQATLPDLLSAQAASTLDLRPGQAYEWLLFVTPMKTADRNPKLEIDSASFLIPFEILGGERRDHVTADLQALEADLRHQGATPEAIALGKANYFLQENLVADALQAMFSVDHPSEDLLAARTAILQEICKTPDPSPSALSLSLE